MIIVSPPFFPKQSNISATVRNYVARAAEPALVSQQDISKITVIDVENKFVAYSGPVKEGVREVMFRGDEIYVLANDGQVDSDVAVQRFFSAYFILYVLVAFLSRGKANLGKARNSLPTISIYPGHQRCKDSWGG